MVAGAPCGRPAGKIDCKFKNIFADVRYREPEDCEDYTDYVRFLTRFARSLRAVYAAIIRQRLLLPLLCFSLSILLKHYSFSTSKNYAFKFLTHI